MNSLLLARAMFDTPTRPTDHVPNALLTAQAIDYHLPPGRIALITGPSGAGKSTILRHIRRLLRIRHHPAIIVHPSPTIPDSTLVIDALRTPLIPTLSILSSCGLADATILERRIRDLSTGQRWRLSLAIALRRAQRHSPHATLLIDEFGASLDPITARCLCRTLHRWIAPRSIRAICCTCDDALLESLAPSLLAIQPLHAPATIHER